MKTLNFIDGDLKLDEAGNLSFVTGAEALRQKLESRLSLSLGSWFLNVRTGVPWVQQILGRGEASLIDGDVGRIFSAELLKEPEVLSVLDSQSLYSAKTREYTYIATVDTVYGKLELEI